jgi:excisionase family DNA binding protein
MSLSKQATDGAGTPRAPLLIRAEEVARLVGVSTRTLWRLVNAGEFPRPIHVGRNTRWRAADVEGWVSRRRPTTEEKSEVPNADTPSSG